MTSNRFVVAALLVLLVASPAVGVAAGQQDIATRGADLVVEQPHYADGDVSTSSNNGTTVYQAQGPILELHPQNFVPGDVVDFGVRTDGGSLSYDQQTGQFTLRPEETGTYTVYWIVAESVAVEEGNNTTTTTRQVRYVANVRVDGPLNTIHLSQSEYEQTREQASRWEEFNATVQNLRTDNQWVALGLQPPLSTEETVQAMVNAYLLVNDTLEALTGRTAFYLFMLVTSLGGALLLLFGGGYYTVVVGMLYRKLNLHETTERAEGAATEKLEQQELEDRKRSVANQSHRDIWNDDHIAASMTDVGRNPLQATTKLVNRLSPRAATAHRLQVMGQNGYVARVDDRDALTDGGEDDPLAGVESVTILDEDRVDEDADVVDLTPETVDDRLLDALEDWDADVIREFDYTTAEWNPERVRVDDLPDTLDEWLELADLDERNFEDVEHAGEHLFELLESVRETTLTDDHGRVDGLRFWLEHQLDAAHVVNDRFELPLDFHIDVLEATIRTHDRAAKARDIRTDIEEGTYA